MDVHRFSYIVCDFILNIYQNTNSNNADSDNNVVDSEDIVVVDSDNI